MKRIPNYLCILVLACFLACNQAHEETQQSSEEPQVQTEVEYPYPALPNELRSTLYNQCDYVDIIFYENPVSMSQSDAPAIRGTLGYLSGRPALPDSNCSALGRVSFMIQGEIVIEADMYSSNNCHYFLFLKDGAVIYAETLSEAGMNFFRQVERNFRQMVQ